MRAHIVAVVAVAAATLAPSAAGAAETDPYYGWMHPPGDGTVALNRGINNALAQGLIEVNRAPPASCRDAAAKLTAPLARTAAYYFAGSTRSWGVATSPRTRTEYNDRFRRESVYRDALLLPFGSLVPLDPTVRVGDVLFGTDKLGHFFTNGFRYFDRYLQARAEGKDEDAAERAAIEIGVDEEKGILGMHTSGIFSFADMEANYQGLQLMRDLCERGGLVKQGASWQLTRPLSIARYVDPCWDEGYNTSAFVDGDEVKKAIAQLCPQWSKPLVTSRLQRYRLQGCHSRSIDVLADLVKRGEAPDAIPFSAATICASTLPSGTSPATR